MLALGLGLMHWNGHYSDPAMLAVVSAAVLTGAGLFVSGSPVPGRSQSAVAVAAGFVVFATLLLDAWFPPGPFSPYLGSPFWQVLLPTLAAIFSALAILHPARWPMIGVFAVFAVAGVVAAVQLEDPRIDVLVFLQEAAPALVRGKNPWAMDFPQIYPDDVAAAIYGPGLVQGDRLMVGYPYPPLVLLWMAPFELAGEGRIASVAAMLITGIFLAAIAPGPLARAAAIAFLFSPRNFHVIEQAWTEPVSAMCLAGFAWSWARRPGLAPWFFGLFLASKQYCVLLLPLALLALPETRRAGFLVRALGVATAVMLPFFLWDPRAFWDALVAFQFQQPFRENALSIAAWIARGWGWHLPPIVSFGLAGVALWGVSHLGRAGLFRFLAGGAIVLLVFFGTNKQAFCNYYFLVIGILATAVAVLPVKPRQA